MSKDRAAQLVEAGIWLKLSGDREGARKLFERALKLDPGNEKAEQLLAGAPDPANPPAEPPVPLPTVATAAASNPFERPEHGAPLAAESDWGMATGYQPNPTPLPTLDGDWGRMTGASTPVPAARPTIPGPFASSSASNVVLGSPVVAAQAPVEQSAPRATMQFFSPSVRAEEPPAPRTTMQFSRPPELEAALAAARAQVESPPPVDPAGLAARTTMQFTRPPEVEALAAQSPPPAESESEDLAARKTMQFTRPPELEGLRPPPVDSASLGAQTPMQFTRPPEVEALAEQNLPLVEPEIEALVEQRPPALGDDAPPPKTSIQFTLPPEVQAAAPQAPLQDPLAPVPWTMQFARPPEVEALAAQAREPKSPPPGPEAPSPRMTMQFARPAEVEALAAPAQQVPAADPLTPAPWTMQFTRPPEVAALAAQAWGQGAQPEGPRTTMQFARPSDLEALARQSPASPELSSPLRAPAASAVGSPEAPVPLPGLSPSAAPVTAPAASAMPDLSQDWGSFAPLPVQSWGSTPSQTVQLGGSAGPEVSPPSTPPLFGHAASGEALAAPDTSKPLSVTIGGDPGPEIAPPSTPPLFSAPVHEEPAPARTTTDPMGYAWAWSSSSPPPRLADPEDSLEPRPSPSLAPAAESAWDQRSNPGIKLDAVAGQNRALDLISSDSKVARSPEAQKEQIRALLRAARDLLELDDHTGAMELIVKAQNIAPSDPDVLAMRDRSERTLLNMFESKLGKLETIPRVLLKDDEIIWLNLDHRAGFVLAQIDATVSFEDLFSVSGMSRIDTARILAQLVEEGVISRG